MDAHALDLSLDRLKTGVDNIRHDVYLSADFCRVVRNFLFQILVKQARTEQVMNSDPQDGFRRCRQQFQRQYREISLYGINRAKSEGEDQIDHLVQVAVVKLLLQSLSEQYDHFQGRLKEILQEVERSNNRDEAKALGRKMFAVQENRDGVMLAAGREVFQIIGEINRADLNEMRRINFKAPTLIPDAVFSSPILFAEYPFDDYFTLRHYEIMFGHRPEDPDRYEALLETLGRVLAGIEDPKGDAGGPSGDPNLAAWLKSEKNVDALFNCFETRHRCRSARGSGSRGELRRLEALSREQKRRLRRLCRGLQKHGAMKKILAVCEMQSIYLDFCPPLVPQLIAQFFIDARVRKNVVIRLKKLSKFYGKPFSTRPLHQIRRKIWWTRLRGEYGYLIRFLKNFGRFHRDYQDCSSIQSLMDRIHLMTEGRIVNLSRANNTLYEFLLPHERRFQEKPISSHVILKADVRGSTNITHRMIVRNLNPASYFSLNFFDPITDILPDYGAEKVFVEGDAIILSLFERGDDPTGRYSVARACGLAVSILSIVNSCNRRNVKYRLPGIELGIGITYAQGRPAFLFDGDQRIMISAAINIADRLSGCSKPLREALFSDGAPFNLYVFQAVSDEAVSQTADDLFLRYNVNGIELSEAGFRKLREEIRLRPFFVNISARAGQERMRFYTGKFPLINGGYQRLVIRESPIVRVAGERFTPKADTGRRYYEICTNPRLREVASNLPQPS